MTERLRENSRTAVYFFDESPAKEQAEGTLQEKISLAFSKCVDAITRAFVRAE
jgi:hypothetical protein